jgi:glutamate synthase (NADPH/NADH) small chain
VGTGGDWQVPGQRLEAHFADKKPAFDRGEALAEASRCLYCYDAPCIGACPTHIDIPTFIRKIATGNLRGSARTILEANLLGKSCSVVCPVEVLCEGSCVYTSWGRKPIEIGRLQRFAMDQAQSPDLLSTSPTRSGKSVGLVGGGPASLACAGTLARMGHEAVIYERGALPGGLNVTGVAPYKLRAEAALAEVEFIRRLGVKVQTGVEIGGDLTADELLARHEAVFLGIGLGEDSYRGVPEPMGDGIVGAVEWIAAMKLDPKASLEGIHTAVVVGGGNTALDVCQEMASLGVPKVVLVYRKCEKRMPGYRHEWAGAKSLRVQLLDHAVITDVVRTGVALEGVVISRTEHGATGESVDTVECDLVVVATGQERLQSLVAQFPGVACDELGRVVADADTLATGNPRIFAGGDCRNGGKEVVNAADEGQRAAKSIDALLRQG